jgi:hypothetical protein
MIYCTTLHILVADGTYSARIYQQWSLFYQMASFCMKSASLEELLEICDFIFFSIGYYHSDLF